MPMMDAWSTTLFRFHVLQGSMPHNGILSTINFCKVHGWMNGIHKSLIMVTILAISQLCADYSGLQLIPEVITDCAICIVVTH